MAAFLGKRYIGIIGTGAGIGQGGIYIQTASGAAPYVPPIDSMTASPEFAWSVWQMSASQTQCVRLRRDSDNAESDFGFSANGLVDVSAINTWLGGANAYVVTLYGVTRSATETTAAEQFQWFNSGGLDNKPYFAFFNNSGVLADERYLLSTDVTTIVDYDIFVGCNFTKASSFSYHFTTANSFRGYFLPNFTYLQTRPNAGLILNSSAIIDGDNLFELNRSSGTVEGFANQISFGTGVNTDNTTISHLFGQGVNTEFVSELVLFKSFLSIPDRSIYLSSYNSRYNKSLPTGPAELYFAAVQAQGGTLTDNVKNEFTAFVNREVDAGRWSKIKRLYPYLGGVINSARIDAITLNQATNFNFVDADADPLIGLQGDGSTKHLRAGYSFEDVVTDPKDKLQYGVFTDGFSSVGVRNTFALAALDTVAAYYYYPLIATSGTLFSYIGTSSAGFISGATNTANLRKISGARFSTTSLYALLDGVESAENTNDSSSVVAATREICLFGRNLNGTFRDFMTEKAVLMYMSEFDTLAETKAFENSYETFLTNIQANAAAQAYFSAVESAGGSLTETVKSEFTSFVTREIENNRWNKIKRLYPFLGGVIDSARIDAITLAQATNNNFVDADADATCGLQGDGSTKSLLESENTNVILSSINHGVGVIFDGTVTHPSAFQGIAGVYDSSTTAMVSIQLDTLDRIRFYSPALADQVLTTSTSFDSIIGFRESSTSQKLAINTSVSVNTTSASTSTLTGVKIGYFGRSFDGTVFNHNSLKYLGLFIEEDMNESEILALRTSYKTFLTNITASSFDPDAEAYFTAAGITDPTEKAAVNQLVLDLKGTGSTPNGTDLWTDAAAFYPISPTSLSAAAYNLRDTTSFNMTWANSPTHASTGVTFNGSTQYGDTGFNPNVETLANGYDITLGAQIVNASVTAVGLMSAVLSTSSRTGMLLISGNIYQDIHNTAGGRLITSAGGTLQGRMIVSADRIANGGRANYLNGTSLGTASTESQGIPVNLSLWVGAQNNGSGGQNFTAIEMRFGLIIPKGLNATAVADLDDAIVRYSTALSRNV